MVKLQKHTKTRDYRTNALDMSNRLQESWTDLENSKETVGLRSRILKKSQEFPEISRGSQKLPEKYGIYDYQLWVGRRTTLLGEKVKVSSVHDEFNMVQESDNET